MYDLAIALLADAHRMRSLGERYEGGWWERTGRYSCIREECREVLIRQRWMENRRGSEREIFGLK
jgi:hypothetical protein